MNQIKLKNKKAMEVQFVIYLLIGFALLIVLIYIISKAGKSQMNWLKWFFG